MRQALMALAAVSAVVAVACGSPAKAPPEQITREIPSPGQVDPQTGDPIVEDIDASVMALDGGCCTVPFALAALEGEVDARLVFRSLRFGMTKAGNAWSVSACVPLLSTPYYFETAYPADGDAGVLWVQRVNEAVAISLSTTVAPEVNVFTAPDAGTCVALDGAGYGRLPGQDGGTDAGPGDAGSSDAGSTTYPYDGGLPTKTVIAGACDTMSAATVLAAGDGGVSSIDEVLAPIAALPFTVRFFGSNMTHFIASSNGYLQLFTSSSGVGTQSLSPTAIPDALQPNGMVAPFWDDLTGVAGTKIQSQVFGTGNARHLTVEWLNFVPFLSDTARLTFQVKLFEATSAIELHWCTLAPNGATDQIESGLTATTGIESPDGTKGVQHTRQSATLSPANAVHFE